MLSRVNLCSVMRNVKVFGADVEVFRPERWLEVAEDKVKEMERDMDLVFSYGRYVCLGRQISLIEQGKVIVEVSAPLRNAKKHLLLGD